MKEQAMSISRCLSKWRQGKAVLGITLHFSDPAVFELASWMQFDVIWVDLEHHAHSLDRVGELMRGVRSGTSDVLARPAKGEFTRLARLLEAGANGIIYPQCASSEEARQVVYHAKFPPLGERGVDGAGPDAGYGTVPLRRYLENANKETFLIVQIEDKRGLTNASAIAQVDGIDMLFFGPGDYSVREGFAGDFTDPRYWEAVEEVARAAKSAGKMWGTPAFSADHAEKLLGMGAMLVTYSSDLSLLRRRLAEIQEEFGRLGFDF